MTEEERFACTVCGERDSVLHRFRAPLAEAWAERNRGNIKVSFGSLTSVVAWLEERTHEADGMAASSTTQKDRRYNRGRADAYRQAAMSILEIDAGTFSDGKTGVLQPVKVEDIEERA